MYSNVCERGGIHTISFSMKFLLSPLEFTVRQKEQGRTWKFIVCSCQRRSSGSSICSLQAVMLHSCVPNNMYIKIIVLVRRSVVQQDHFTFFTAPFYFALYVVTVLLLIVRVCACVRVLYR